MNSGSIGVVVTINRMRRLKPRVVLVLTPEKLPYLKPKIVNLSERAGNGSHREELAVGDQKSNRRRHLWRKPDGLSTGLRNTPQPRSQAPIIRYCAPSGSVFDSTSTN